MLNAIILMLVLVVLWDILLQTTAAIYFKAPVKHTYATLQTVMFWFALSYVLSNYSFHWPSMLFIGIGIKLLVYAVSASIVSYGGV